MLILMQKQAFSAPKKKGARRLFKGAKRPFFLSDEGGRISEIIFAQRACKDFWAKVNILILKGNYLDLAV